MNCKFFRKHLREYINEELFSQMKDSMDEHLESCSSCRALYNSELELDKMLFRAFKHEEVAFKSSRSAILSSIDKRKYSKGPINKIKYSLMKNKFKIGSSLTAAVLVFFILNGQGLFLGNGGLNREQIGDSAINNYEVDKSVAKDSIQGVADVENYQRDSSDFLKSVEEMFSAYAHKETPKFDITDRSPEEKYINPSSWKSNNSNSYSAMLEGKGEMNSHKAEPVDIRLMEEGIATIVVKNNELGQYKNFRIRNENEVQLSPSYIEWVDDNNMLVVVGYGYGTVSLGGSLYLLNIDTGKTILLYEPDNPKKEYVVTAAQKEDYIELKLAKYLDDILNSYRIEKRVINYEYISLEHEASGMISSFKNSLKHKDYNEAMKLFSEDFSSKYEASLGNLKAIEGVKINRIIKVDNYVEDSQLEFYGYEDMITYCMEAEYSLSKGYQGILSGGIDYQYIILVRELGSQNWKIAYIYTAV